MDLRYELLQCHLAVSVPLWIERQRSDDFGRLQWRLMMIGARWREHADATVDVMLGGGPPGSAALTVEELAQGLAILALTAAGGVRAFGLRFHADGRVTAEPAPAPGRAQEGDA